MGSPLSCASYCGEFVSSKVQVWKSVLVQLSEIAVVQPHVAYAAYTHGLSQLWVFLCCTTPDVQHLLSPLDEVIIHQFVPSLIGRPVPGSVLSSLFSLPTRLGGLNISPRSSHVNEFKVLSQEALIKQPITVHLELYLFYRFIHFLLYIGQY